MLTPERLAALRDIDNGTVKVRKISAPGNPFRFEPREQTVAIGFLLKAQLVTVTAGYAAGRRRPSTVELTDRGRDALARATA